MQRSLPSATILSIALLAGLLAACNRNNEAKEAETAATPPESAAAPAAPSETGPAPAKAAPTDLDKLADRVVTQSAGVKEGEIVLINGQPTDGELLENLAVSVRKAGGFPIVFYDTDRLDKRMIQGDPHPVAKYRVNGPLSNLPAFSAAFNCKPGDAMVRSEKDRCDVW